MAARPLSSLRRCVLSLLLVMVTALSVIALSACGTAAGDGTSLSPSPSAQLPRGQAIFARYCNSCHPGGSKGVGPSLVERLPALSDDQVRTTVRSGKNRMPGFAPGAILDDELTELIAYIRAFR